MALTKRLVTVEKVRQELYRLEYFEAFIRADLVAFTLDSKGEGMLLHLETIDPVEGAIYEYSEMTVKFPDNLVLADKGEFEGQRNFELVRIDPPASPKVPVRLPDPESVDIPDTKTRRDHPDLA